MSASLLDPVTKCRAEAFWVAVSWSANTKRDKLKTPVSWGCQARASTALRWRFRVPYGNKKYGFWCELMPGHHDIEIAAAEEKTDIREA